jgi:hypothetical protein
VPGAGSHALLTRPPLDAIPKDATPFDLHVLGAPPAFVLSQDQTLSFIPPPPGTGPPSRSRRRPLGPPTLPKLQPAPAGGSLRHRLGTFSQRSRRQDPKDIPASRTRLCQKMPEPNSPLRPPPAHPFLLHHNVKYHKADWRRLRPQPFRPRKAEPHYVVEVSDRRQRSRYLGLLTLPFKPFLRLPHDLHPSHRRPAGTFRWSASRLPQASAKTLSVPPPAARAFVECASREIVLRA